MQFIINRNNKSPVDEGAYKEVTPTEGINEEISYISKETLSPQKCEKTKIWLDSLLDFSFL